MQGQQPGIAALPQPLLVHIIGLLDFWLLRTTVPLVCRAWRDATADADAQLFTCVAVDWSVECRPAPALYPSHRDQPYLDIAAVGRWLARRLPQLAHLHLELRWSQHFNHPAFDQLAVAQDWGPTNTAALLASLAPKLVSLRLLACDNLLADGDLLGALWPLSGLTSLRLDRVGAALSARRCNSGLRHLSRLQRFAVSCRTTVSSGSPGKGLSDFPDALLSLPALRTLSLEYQADVGGLPDELSRATALQELCVRCCNNQAFAGLPDSTYQLASLTALELVASNADNAPPMLTPAVSGLSRLQHLHWRAPLPQVDLAGLAGLTSLTFLHVDNKAVNTQPRLPTPDLPPALSALRHLQVLQLRSDTLSMPPWLLRLPQLHTLSLDSNWSRYGDQGADAAGLAPQLTRLDIHANDLLRLPSWVCRCAQLCRLVVTGARLANLPDSISRLTGLDHLTVELSQVPPVLAGLTSLRHLHLKATPISEDGAAVLLSLPCLWRLECSWRGREEALVQLGQQLLDRHGHSVLAGYPPAT